MTTIRELLSSATATGQVEARHEAEILLCHALGRSRAWLFAHADFEPTVAVCENFSRLLSARRGGEPIAYLIGRRGFWTLDLAVTPDVLIPRAETELLVELALARIPPDTDSSVLDLGTGSGAIALAIASERPRAHVVATDVSAAALAVARANAQRLEVGNIEFLHGDWYAALAGQRFDIIVSNPPYIADGDAHLRSGDLRFEPAAALASGADGLDAIRILAAGAARHLSAHAWILLEHGWNQAASARALLEANGFCAVESALDIAAHERVTLGRLRR